MGQTEVTHTLIYLFIHSSFYYSPLFTAPPTVRVSPITQFHTTGSSVVLQCYVGGVPEPAGVEWEMNEAPLTDDPDNQHYLLLRKYK